jgi:predicted DNA-binding transcriptional regulator AlpA
MKFDELSDEAIVRLPTVQSLFGVSAPTVWRWSKSGLLPSPVKFGGITGWRVSDLRAVISHGKEGAHA